jgi:cobalt-precorrin 5A hydrolase
MNVSQRSIALVTLSANGLAVARQLAGGFTNCDVYVHTGVVEKANGDISFDRVAALTASLFQKKSDIIFILPTGVAVRAIAPVICHKKKDPAVVVVDVGARYAISLLSGHEGGANQLAFEVGNIIGAEPVITTTTEAEKYLVVGVGCRRETGADEIQAAVNQTLSAHGYLSQNVRLWASADIKSDESGLIEAARRTGVMLRFVPSDEIRSCAKDSAQSPFVLEKVKLPGVAEPAALLAGRKTVLVVSKQKYQRVTVAIAKENCF